MAWYDSSWTYRVKITVQSSKVGATLTDFPVYVDLSDLPAGFFTNVDSAGDDIRVTESDGTTECAIEVVSINTGSSTGELHFLASSISAVSNTDFYIYYGNAAASAYAVGATYGRNAVWADYEAVYHLNSTTDSTGNSNTLTANGGLTTGGASGKVGVGTEFDGTDDYYDCSGVLGVANKSTNHSFSAWFKTDTISATGQNIFASLNGSSDRVVVKIIDLTDQIRANVFTGSWVSSNIASAAFSDTTNFHHISYSFNSTTGITAWLDGVSMTGSNNSGAAVGTYAQIGAGLSSEYFDGIIGETRVRVGELSADWISTEYNNQNDTSTFFSIGTQETEPTGTYRPKLFFFS